MVRRLAVTFSENDRLSTFLLTPTTIAMQQEQTLLLHDRKKRNMHTLNKNEILKSFLSLHASKTKSECKKGFSIRQYFK